MADNKTIEPIRRGIPVMDIQAPRTMPPVKPATPTAQSVVPVSLATPEEAPLATPPPVEDEQPTAPAGEVTDPEPTPDTTEPVEPDTLTADPAPAEAPAEPNPMAITPRTVTSHHTAPVGAIIAAIVVAVALAGVSVLAYTKSQKPAASKPAAQTQAAATPASAAPVSGNDVQQESQTIDQSLQSLDDANDFSQTSVSDASLGL